MMAHLRQSEMLHCFDSMFKSLYGGELYQKWKDIKLALKFDTEKLFVSWMLGIVEENFLSAAAAARYDEEECEYSEEVQAEDAGGMETKYETREDVDDSAEVCDADDSEGLQRVDEVKLEQPSPEDDNSNTSAPGSTSAALPYSYSGSAEQQANSSEAVMGLAVFTNSFDPTTGSSSTAGQRHYAADMTQSAGHHPSSPSVGGGPGGRLCCKFCRAEFASAGSLRLHVKYLHLKEHNQQYTCHCCAHVFASQFERTQHESAAHPDLVKSFTCDVCSKCFSSKKNMTAHRRSIHFNEKSYPCAQCDKVFSLSWNLNRHIRSSHPSLAAAPPHDAATAAGVARTLLQERGGRGYVEWPAAVQSQGEVWQSSGSPGGGTQAVVSSGDVDVSTNQTPPPALTAHHSYS